MAQVDLPVHSRAEVHAAFCKMIFQLNYSASRPYFYYLRFLINKIILNWSFDSGRYVNKQVYLSVTMDYDKSQSRKKS